MIGKIPLIREGSNIKELESGDSIDANLSTSDYVLTSAKILSINAGQTVTVDYIDITEAKVVEWILNVVDQTLGTYYSAMIFAHYDGVNASFTEYASLGQASIEVDVYYENGQVKLNCTALQNNQSVRVVKTAIKFT